MTRILLVEDDETHRELLQRHLLLEGYQVTSAANGMQAIILAQSDAPDVILMDMGLPLMDGWQATRHLKALPATRTIPLVALTAYATREDLERCRKAGCDAWETKPIEFPRLWATLRTLLQQERHVGKP